MWDDGTIYEGYWAHNQPHGNGRIVHDNGDVYDGEWKNAKAHGIGFYGKTDNMI